MATQTTAAGECLLNDLARRIAQEPDFANGNSAQGILYAVSDMLSELETSAIVNRCLNTEPSNQ